MSFTPNCLAITATMMMAVRFANAESTQDSTIDKGKSKLKSLPGWVIAIIAVFAAIVISLVVYIVARIIINRKKARLYGSGNRAVNPGYTYQVEDPVPPYPANDPVPTYHPGRW